MANTDFQLSFDDSTFLFAGLRGLDQLPELPLEFFFSFCNLIIYPVANFTEAEKCSVCKILMKMCLVNMVNIIKLT